MSDRCGRVVEATTAVWSRSHVCCQGQRIGRYTCNRWARQAPRIVPVVALVRRASPVRMAPAGQHSRWALSAATVSTSCSEVVDGEVVIAPQLEQRILAGSLLRQALPQLRGH